MSVYIKILKVEGREKLGYPKSSKRKLKTKKNYEHETAAILDRPGLVNPVKRLDAIYCIVSAPCTTFSPERSSS